MTSNELQALQVLVLSESVELISSQRALLEQTEDVQQRQRIEAEIKEAQAVQAAMIKGRTDQPPKRKIARLAGEWFG